MALWSWKSVLSWALRVTTLLSSLATVILFIVFLVDRTDLENIQAWQILQGYKGGDNVGLTFALETLVRNHQSLRHLVLPGRPLRLDGADLRGADMKFARFGDASFESTRLDHTNLADSVVAYSDFHNCRCRGTDFSNSFLEGRVPESGVGAVGKWPAVATVQSLAKAGHLSTAVVIACLR
jgi:hypothetical protein